MKIYVLSAFLLFAGNQLAIADVRPPVKEFYKLPLNGNYGNDSGCNAIADKEPVSDDMQYLSSEEFNRWETNCRFVAAYELSGEDNERAWTVITACSVEGDTYSELISVKEWKDFASGDLRVTVTSNRDELPVELTQCK